MSTKQVVQFAREVLEMQDRINWLECEVARLSDFEHKYNESIRDSISHNQAMIGGLFTLGMKLAREKDEGATP